MSDHSISPPLKKPLRTFEQAELDRANLRSQRMALKICLDCGMPRHAETEYCEQHFLERLYAGDEI